MAELAESNRRRAKKGRKAPVAPVSSDEEDDDDLGAADGYRKPEGEHGVDFNIKTLLKIRTVEWKKVSVSSLPSLVQRTLIDELRRLQGHLADAFSEAKIHPYKRSFKWVVENQGLNLELAIRSVSLPLPATKFS